MANITGIINSSIIPSSITDKITNDINVIFLILKAIGILIIIYVIFLIIKWVSDFIRNRRIKKIYQKVNEMDEKIDEIDTKIEGIEKKIIDVGEKVFMLLERSKVKGEKGDKKEKK